MFAKILEWLADALQWLLDALLWLPLKLFELFMQGFVAVLSAIPVPAWMENMTFANIPSSVAYFAEAMQIEYGIGIMVTAYIVRFIIRRLPVIG